MCEDLNEQLNILNICLSALMAALCFSVFPHLNNRGDRGFATFWGAQWVILASVYSLFQFTGFQTEPQYFWIMQCVDMIGNAFLFIAAFALYRGDQFMVARNRDAAGRFQGARVDKALDWMIGIFATMTVVTALLGIVSSRTYSPSWFVFVMAPSQILACGGFIALGLSAGARFPEFRAPIYIICFLYALIQIPAYYALFVEPVYLRALMKLDQNIVSKFQAALQIGSGSCSDATVLLKGLLAAGKLLIIANAIAILKIDATNSIKYARIILSIFNVLLYLLWVIFKITHLPYEVARPQLTEIIFRPCDLACNGGL